jgi:hypothetical protein
MLASDSASAALSTLELLVSMPIPELSPTGFTIAGKLSSPREEEKCLVKVPKVV